MRIRDDLSVTPKLVIALLQARRAVVDYAGQRLPETFDLIVKPDDAHHRLRRCQREYCGERQGGESGFD
jgi:hypothetical protein